MGPNQEKAGQNKEPQRKVYNLTPEQSLSVPEELQKNLLTPLQIKKLGCLPIRKEEDGTIIIAAARAEDLDLEDTLRRLLGKRKFKLEAHDAAKIAKALEDPYGVNQPKTTVDLSVDQNPKTVDISPGERMPAGFR